MLLSVGVKESTSLNNVFTILNLTTIAIVLVSGSIKGSIFRTYLLYLVRNLYLIIITEEITSAINFN